MNDDALNALIEDTKQLRERVWQLMESEPHPWRKHGLRQIAAAFDREIGQLRNIVTIGAIAPEDAARADQ